MIYISFTCHLYPIYKCFVFFSEAEIHIGSNDLQDREKKTKEKDEAERQALPGRAVAGQLGRIFAQEEISLQFINPNPLTNMKWRVIPSSQPGSCLINIPIS